MYKDNIPPAIARTHIVSVTVPEMNLALQLYPSFHTPPGPHNVHLSLLPYRTFSFQTEQPPDNQSVPSLPSPEEGNKCIGWQ